MLAFNPQDAIPSRWSLKPAETLGLVFWTKDPSNLIADAAILQDFLVKIHVTVTGWGEVEKGAPSLAQGAQLLCEAARTFGAGNVTWRFSPVPLVPDVVDRFQRIAAMAEDAGVQSVYLSFLQTNDRMAETRTAEERFVILQEIAKSAGGRGINVRLCNEDGLLRGRVDLSPNLTTGICAPPEDFALSGSAKAPAEGCGCVLMVDPFTVNETCSIGCQYCYAADETLSPRKRNTTRSLPVVP